MKSETGSQYLEGSTDQRMKQTAGDWLGLSWAAARQVSLCTRSPESKVDLEGFSYAFCPDGLNNTQLFKDCLLENRFHCRKGGQSIHCKARGEGEAPLIA